jgi:hypothetical protein
MCQTPGAASDHYNVKLQNSETNVNRAKLGEPEGIKELSTGMEDK